MKPVGSLCLRDGNSFSSLVPTKLQDSSTHSFLGCLTAAAALRPGPVTSSNRRRTTKKSCWFRHRRRQGTSFRFVTHPPKCQRFKSMLEFLWFSLRSQGLSSRQQGRPPLISHFFLSFFFLVLFSSSGLGLLPADNDKGHTCRINDWSALPPSASPGSLF